MEDLPKIVTIEEMDRHENQFWDLVQQTIYIDVKYHSSEDIRTWDYARRATYLINEDAPPPYALDPWVWSSALSEEDLTFFESPRAPLVFEFQNDQLNATFGYKTFTLQKLLYILKTDFPDQHIIGYSPNPELGEMVLGHFPSLGFDVADSWGLSGISNCGYDSAEKSTLKKQIGEALNIHHLFKNEEDAHAFATHCDNRVKEHAPFRVFRLYDLRGTQTD